VHKQLRSWQLLKEIGCMCTKGLLSLSERAKCDQSSLTFRTAWSVRSYVTCLKLPLYVAIWHADVTRRLEVDENRS
jgi:hypothetical protein